MKKIQTFLEEYIRLRRSGLEIREAVQTLDALLQTLTADERSQLGNEIRSWETQPTEFVITPEQRDLLQKAALMQSGHQIICPYCGKPNHVMEIACYACGQQISHFRVGTDQIVADNNDPALYYDTLSTVQFLSSDGLQISAQPQFYPNSMTVGRSTPGSNFKPDIDLIHLGAAVQGVSRLHAAISYDTKALALRIKDLGSANGSWLDGHRIHPSERLLLRDGSLLRLGMLELTVRYSGTK